MIDHLFGARSPLSRVRTRAAFISLFKRLTSPDQGGNLRFPSQRDFDILAAVHHTRSRRRSLSLLGGGSCLQPLENDPRAVGHDDRGKSLAHAFGNHR